MRLRWLVLGAAAATLATGRGRRFAGRTAAAYFRPSIDFQPKAEE